MVFVLTEWDEFRQLDPIEPERCREVSAVSSTAKITSPFGRMWGVWYAVGICAHDFKLAGHQPMRGN